MFHPSAIGVTRFIIKPIQLANPRSAALLSDARALGLAKITRIQVHELYFIESHLTSAELNQLGAMLLSDPVTQTFQWSQLPAPAEETASAVLETALRPGVTDPTSEQIIRAAHELGLQSVTRAATGQRYLVDGNNLTSDDMHMLASRLLANAIIQRYALGEIEPIFPQEAFASAAVEILPIRGLSDAGLLAFSQERRAALDLAEMQAVRAYFDQAGREMTDIEFEMIAQTWSEHCVHKTFRARISIQNPGSGPASIDNLLKTYLRSATESIRAPWVRSAFVDNAGIIEYDGKHELSFKVETHNHPSAIEPFGGANTGVGGVIRDVMGVSAKPIAATDVLCFGPQDLPLEALPDGVLHPRRIQSGVVAGVQDYGNKIGIPTVSGAVLYDEGYTANPLVFCGCVGIAPRGTHRSQPRPGDHIIVLGGRTGRDGLRGATFSSMTMDAQTGAVSGASVQIGDPITEKGVLDLIVLARDEGLYNAITDCGAGGLSSAVGEMASTCGAVVELQDVKLKYPGLAPWEIWLSEAQERMVMAVPAQALARLQVLCVMLDVELTDIGTFNESGRLIVHYNGQPVLNLENAFLHDGLPQRQLNATLPAVKIPPMRRGMPMPPAEALPALLSQPNTASKEAVIRIYDHEVQGATLLKPLTGIQQDAPSDACILRPLETVGDAALVLSAGINPDYGRLDAYRMACSVIDEAVRNAIAVGANPEHIAILDNFCWGDPLRPETLGALVQAAQGCYAAALQYKTPFISGKDSLNNEYLGRDGQRHAIPPTLLISAIGVMSDYHSAVSMDLKQAGSRLYLLGAFSPHFGGSAYARISPGLPANADLSVPPLPENAPALYAAYHRALQNGWIRACHDLSEGGLAVTAAEMCMGGRLGMHLALPAGDPIGLLFGECNGCLLIEVDEAHSSQIENGFQGLSITRLGSVTENPVLHCAQHSQTLLDIPVDSLLEAWKTQP